MNNVQKVCHFKTNNVLYTNAFANIKPSLALDTVVEFFVSSHSVIDRLRIVEFSAFSK
jgi:hypothetical protein